MTVDIEGPYVFQVSTTTFEPPLKPTIFLQQKIKKNKKTSKKKLFYQVLHNQNPPVDTPPSLTVRRWKRKAGCLLTWSNMCAWFMHTYYICISYIIHNIYKYIIICIYVHQITLSICSAHFFSGRKTTKGIFFAQATLASHLIDDGPHWLRKNPGWNLEKEEMYVLSITVHDWQEVNDKYIMLPGWFVLVNWVIFLEKAVSSRWSSMPTNFGTPDWDLSVASQHMATLQNAKKIVQ